MKNRLPQRDRPRIDRRQSNTRAAASRGFTLVELCVVVAAIALLGLTMLPALARTRPNTGISQCMDNARQLAVAVQMYTADNHDLYPPNPDDANIQPGYDWCGGEAQGGGGTDIPVGPQAYNPDIETNLNLCLVAPYLRDAPVFTCPADLRVGTYQGTNASLIGKTVRAARSISMNSALGTIDPTFAASGSGHSGVPNLPVTGSWLTGVHGQNQHDNPWATFGKTADFRVVKPSQVFLITDEDPYSINDSFLALSAGQQKFLDYPASYHDGGCTISFCDGHVELHRWQGTLIILNGYAGFATPTSALDLADWNWLWQHATVRMK